ncbi:MAG: cadmium-translocating P-type ATPase [Clostridia bacterium]|nr:cadmium-translocating P-type ATPase [Clostridia bacterium]
MKLEYKLGRIHCAGCAQALEEILSKVEGVESVSLNFISNMVCFEIQSKNHKEIEENIKKAIHKFDHNIEILDPHAEEKAQKREEIKKALHFVSILVSVAIMVCLIALKMNFYLELGLAIFAYALVGWNICLNAVLNIFKGKVLDENFLMTVATIGAFVLGEFSEAVGVMVFYQIGEIFQNLAVKNSERAIKSIASVKESRACLVLDNAEMDVTLDKVSVGDIIRVKVGERIPLDGVICEGETYLNTSALTGESQEKFVKVGDDVLSGSIVTSAVVLIEVTKLEHESTVSKIVELVEKSSMNKSKTEKFISKFSKYYTPVVVGLALVLGFIVPAFWAYANWNEWLYRALVFLVVSCPCALVISVPLSFFAGVGAAARNGVLVKGANFLEALSQSKTFVFDKTGTLTYGSFKVTNIHAEDDKTEDEILEFVAYAENFSNHRIAKSIVEEYKSKTGKDINFAWINGANEIPGEGVSANIFSIDCLVGNAKLMKDNGVKFVEHDSPFTVVYLAQNGTFAGWVEIQDQIRKEAPSSIQTLKELGAENISMFTGDSAAVAKVVAEKIGVDCYHADLLPEGKVEKLYEHIENGKKLVFVGDGINDAPILSTVDVGIAMGGIGSDIAVESADVVIMDDDLSKIPLGVMIAKRTKRIVTENIVLSLGVKVVVLILASLGLSNMWLGVFADVGVALLAVLNAIRALIVPRKYKHKLDKQK